MSEIIVTNKEELSALIVSAISPLMADLKDDLARRIEEVGKAPQTMSMAEVMAALHCTRQNLNNLMRAGRLKFTKLGSSRSAKVLFKRTDVQNYLEEKTR